MRRRHFLTLAGAAVAWPMAARAQQPAVPVIGFLLNASLEAYAIRFAVFRQGLAEFGYVEGKTVAIEFRASDGQHERLPEMAADLVRRRVAVIMAAGTAAALAAKAATTTIPIVFSTGGDPVESGLVASLARPGGNLTGTTRLLIEVGAKRLQLLHEMMPAARDVALLVNAGNRVMTEPQSRDAKAQVRTRGLKLHVLSASTEREIDEAFATLVKLRVGALMIAVDGFLTAQFTKIAALALQHKIPAIGSNRAFVDAGGLMSYGGNLDDGYAIAGAYAGRMLKGENPADLPVHRSTRFELFINRKTANSLGITIPLLLLAQADEMIE